jgi:hypothetical chaperone protein
MFASMGSDVHYVYEPIGAAYSFASRLSKPATLLVADFGGGTSDFSIVQVAEPGAAQRCGAGVGGYRHRGRPVRLPHHGQAGPADAGQGGTYRSFDKVLEIPDGHFTDFGDWSRLALMRNRRTLAELAKLQRSAVDPEAIGRMIAVVEHELGYPLYEAVGGLKRALSSQTHAAFHFQSDDLTIEAEVSRGIRLMDRPRSGTHRRDGGLALARAGLGAESIDHVFLTGGSSLILAVRALFEARFGEGKIDSGGELTSIAHGLALIGQEADMGAWTVQDEDA